MKKYTAIIGGEIVRRDNLTRDELGMANLVIVHDIDTYVEKDRWTLKRVPYSITPDDALELIRTHQDHYDRVVK